MSSDEDSLHKKQKVLSETLVSEFNLEIGLRERLTELLHARIAWASLLKESLTKDTQTHIASPDFFRYAALDSLRAAEKPFETLSNIESPAPPNIRLQEALRHARPPPRPKALLPRNSKSTFLYIRPLALSGMGNDASDLYILKCPVCFRTTFTSLQGLLNHARISHTLEWGTHEECIRACMVADPGLDVTAGIEVGVGSGGILPGIRTIFEMAVGPSQSGDRIGSDFAGSGGKTARGVDFDSSALSHLTRTLGLHENSPALAPFLGKEPIRRGIKAHQQDELLDIDCHNEETSLPDNWFKNRWRPHFAQRGVAGDIKGELETGLSQSLVKIDDFVPGVKALGAPSVDDKLAHSLLAAVTTRFHFTTRVVVTDRSLWIDSSQDEPFTHKWMLTLHSPSYARNIATVLRSMKVTPMLPDDVVRCHQPITDLPPYAVVGVASEPFLAQVDLTFNNVEGENFGEQTFSMEHWVDLDPLKSPVAAIGLEQTCDIELDKRTTISPVSTETASMNFKALWNFADKSLVKNTETKQPVNDNLRPAHEEILSDLLPRFPLTLPEPKRRRGLNLPYKLVTSSQFSKLVEGRRKAIEWGRIRALRDAYNKVVEEKQTVKPLIMTAADVYAWLREGGHLQQGNQVKSDVAQVISSKPNESSRWCPFCGLENALHSPLVKGEESHAKNEITTDIRCWLTLQTQAVLRLRPVDVHHPAFTTASPAFWDRVQGSQTRVMIVDKKTLVRFADPHLALAVRQLIDPLGLSSFKAWSTSTSPFPLDCLEQTSEGLEATLAPYSLLALCLRPFIRRIIRSGLGIAEQQKSIHKHAYPTKRGIELRGSPVSLLTPTHVLTGIGAGGRGVVRDRDDVDEAILLCLSKLGTVFDSRRHGSDLRKVKVEEA